MPLLLLAVTKCAGGTNVNMKFTDAVLLNFAALPLEANAANDQVRHIQNRLAEATAGCPRRVIPDVRALR